MESFGDWEGQRKEIQGIWEIFNKVSDSEPGFFLFVCGFLCFVFFFFFLVCNFSFPSRLSERLKVVNGIT